MAETNETPVLRRMVGANAVKVSPSAMTLAKALRMALARAGDEALKVAVTTRGFDEGTYLPEDLDEFLPEVALYLMLQGPDGSLGAAVICPQVLGAVIEAATMGQVKKAEAAERRATGTDAALTRAFLDPVLNGFSQMAAMCQPPPPVGGYVCGQMLGDGRAAQMMLVDAVHIRLTAEVDFSLGAKTGKITLILPQERQATTQTPAGDQHWSETLTSAVMRTNAVMEAQLARLKLPLKQVTALAVDQVLPLGNATLDSVRMIGPDDQRLMQARLGRSGGWRAVKLAGPLVDGTAAAQPAPANFEAAGDGDMLATTVAHEPMPQMGDLANGLDDPALDMADPIADLGDLPVNMGESDLPALDFDLPTPEPIELPG